MLDYLSHQANAYGANAHFVNSHTNIHSNKWFRSQNSVLPDNHGSQMGAILQSVKHYQYYIIQLYSFAIVVEYHKGLSMWADYYVAVLSSI